MSEIFPNAPLVEAILELRFAGEIAVEVARPKIQEVVRSELPNVFVPKSVPDVALALQPYQLRAADDSEIVGLAINRFSYHSQRYQGYARFRERFLHFYSVFSQHVQVHRLTRLGLRYINHIPVLRPSEHSPIPLEDYVNVGFRLPSSIPADLTQLNSVFTVRLDKDRLRILLEHKVLEGPAQREILVLDFDFVQSEQLDIHEIENYLEKAHSRTKQVFLDLISLKYFPVMRGETS